MATRGLVSKQLCWLQTQEHFCSIVDDNMLNLLGEKQKIYYVKRVKQAKSNKGSCPGRHRSCLKEHMLTSSGR